MEVVDNLGSSWNESESGKGVGVGEIGLLMKRKRDRILRECKRKGCLRCLNRLKVFLKMSSLPESRNMLSIVDLGSVL